LTVVAGECIAAIVEARLLLQYCHHGAAAAALA
jgi:hypothetical protein